MSSLHWSMIFFTPKDSNCNRSLSTVLTVLWDRSLHILYIITWVGVSALVMLTNAGDVGVHIVDITFLNCSVSGIFKRNTQTFEHLFLEQSGIEYGGVRVVCHNYIGIVHRGCHGSESGSYVTG